MKPATFRRAAVAVVLVVGGCSGGATEAPTRVACALAGAKSFAEQCLVERVRSGATLQLVVRHPDGGFRRFDVLDDGRGLAAADGADVAEVKIDGALLDVRIGLDRYKFPVTRKADAPAP